MFRRATSALAVAAALSAVSGALPVLTVHTGFAATTQAAADDAACADASDGAILGDFAECFYNAVTTSGRATADAVSNLPAEIDITVQDLSAGGGTVASCKATGTGSFELSCPYAEIAGHQYDVTASDPTFNDLVLALVAEG
jgi:hypothetical protein